MYTIRINGANKKRLTTYKGNMTIDQLNAVTYTLDDKSFKTGHHKKTSFAQLKYGEGAYAIRHVKK